MVEKNIHQIWIQGENNLPTVFHDYVDKWKRIAEKYGYTYRLWSEKDYLPFLLKYGMEEHSNSRNNMTQRSDIARWLILSEYGGFYVDVDIEPLFSDGFPEWRSDLILMRSPVGILSSFTLQSAFIGVKRGHSLAEKMISRMKETTNPKIKVKGSWNYISSTTGSLLIKSLVDSNPEWNVLWLDSPLITFDFGNGYYLSDFPQNTKYFIVHQISCKECNIVCWFARLFSMFPPWWIFMIILVFLWYYHSRQ